MLGLQSSCEAGMLPRFEKGMLVRTRGGNGSG